MKVTVLNLLLRAESKTEHIILTLHESFEPVWDDGSDEVIPVSPWELDV